MTQPFSGPRSNLAVPLLGLALRVVLLLALLGVGSLPSGFMRVATPSGLTLVLCTAEGPREITLDAAGNEIPPDEDGQRGDQAPCLLSGSHSTLPAPLLLLVTSSQHHKLPTWHHSHQIATRAPPQRSGSPRGPPDLSLPNDTDINAKQI